MPRSPLTLTTSAAFFCLAFVVITLSHPARIAVGSLETKVSASAASPGPNPAATFEWRMPSRFGPKRPDGIVDYHFDIGTRTYEKDYVQPQGWKVEFDACSLVATPGSVFVWEVDGIALQNPSPQSCTFSHEFTRQGTYNVKLLITASDSTVTVINSPVTVKDLLIVSLGDSFASGQGNPDLRKQGSTAAKWVEKICARSAFAGPAQAALSIEQADPHTSVTFVSFACSGAEITAGILGEQTKGTLKLAPQIDKLKEALDGRPLDALIISVGGNDIGFAELVADCIQQIDCHRRVKVLEKFRERH